MAKKTKKQRREKKRKEIRKHQRSRKSALPALLRQNPDLHEALNYRYPLVKTLINEDWETTRMANVIVIREAPTGLVLSCFLVDLSGLGLKDVWGNYGLTETDIDELESKSEAGGNPLTTCDLSLATTIVHGGIAWAEKWRFKLPKEYKIWLRLLAPAPSTEIDLGIFGEDGKPVLILEEDELDILEDEAFDPEILKRPIDIGDEGPSRATLARIGDIKRALIRFSQSATFSDAFQEAFEDQFGEDAKPDTEHEWISFQDWFVLENVLEDGTTIAERFLEQHKHTMSDDVREMILGWENVLASLFEVKEKTAHAYIMKCLVNEKEYSVFAATPEDDFQLAPGDFAHARIVPVKDFHVFSGGLSLFESDGSQEFRAEMYEMAVDFQMKHPGLAFQDNAEKLQKSLEVSRRHHDDFINLFGTDEVCGTGKEIRDKYQSFLDYMAFERKDPETGVSTAEAFEKKTGEQYHRPFPMFPKDVLKASDVGMLSHPVAGVEILIDYQRFINIFQFPETQLNMAESEDLVLGYLGSDTVSDVPFRKVARKFPENFDRVMNHYLDTDGASPDLIDNLMWKFKPETFDKLPSTVAVMDAEMSRLIQDAKRNKASKDPRSRFAGLKGVFKRNKKEVAGPG